MESLQYIQKMKFKFIFVLIFIFQISFSQKLVEKTKPILRNNIYFFENEKGPYTLNLEISNLKNNEGFIALELLDINNIRIAATSEIKIVNFKSTVKIDSLKRGKYVVQYYHDENKNGKLDLGLFGIPKESYGNSKNVLGFMGPPKFKDMIFDLSGNVKLRMRPVN